MATIPGNGSTTTIPEAARPFIAAIAQHHKRSVLSDIAITLYEDSHPVHRLVLGLHSTVLAKACAETPTGGSIDLRKHVKGVCFPGHVEAMVKFMYTFDYDAPWNEEEDNMGLTPEMIPAFHLAMASLAEELGIKGLDTLAVTKFQTALFTTKVSVQTFIKLARLAFDENNASTSIRTALVSYATENPSLGITVYAGEPQPLLSVFLKTDDGSYRRFPTLTLASNPTADTSHKNKTPYRCLSCGKDQWRDDIVQLDVLYYCQHCNCEATGGEWGLQGARRRQRSKSFEEDGEQSFDCPGCDETQRRDDIQNDSKVYECRYCGWEELGRTWVRLKEAGEDDF